MEVELGYFMNEFVEIELKALSYKKKNMNPITNLMDISFFILVLVLV